MDYDRMIGILLISMVWTCMLTSHVGAAREVSFNRSVIRAQCLANCLKQFGSTTRRDWRLNVYDFYQTSSNCSSVDCHKCKEACQDNFVEDYNDCAEHCLESIRGSVLLKDGPDTDPFWIQEILENSKSPIEQYSDQYVTQISRKDEHGCLEGCQCLFRLKHQLDNNAKVQTSMVQVNLSTPKKCCVSFNRLATTPKGGDGTKAIVHLTWNINAQGSTQKTLPFGFVLEIRYRTKQPVEETPWQQFTTFVARVDMLVDTGTEYQHRITPVLPDGLAGTSVYSAWDIVQQGSIMENLKPPKYVKVSRQKVIDSEVYVLIEWTQEESDQLCQYNMALLPYAENILPLERAIGPLPEFKYWIGPLAYDIIYTVKMATCMSGSLCSKNTSQATFHTISCLNATEYNLNLCAPHSPVNFTYTVEKDLVEAQTLTNKSEKDCPVMVDLKWSTSQDNLYHGGITHYRLVWHRMPALTKQDAEHEFGNVTLPPNVTNYKIYKMQADTYYYVVLWAESPGGTSGRKSMRIDTKGSNKCHDNDVPGFSRHKTSSNLHIILPITIIAVVVVTVAVGFYLYHVHQQCQKMKLDKALRTHTPNPLYCSVAESSSPSCISAGNISDEYEISAGSVHVYGRLGEGAFGHVMKGDLLSPPKWMSVELLPMTVAVKTLKDYPTQEETRCLFNEIQLMKNLGRHDNIVSIVAACTQDQPLCLLMDYCSKGDLRKYLHHLRNKCARSANFYFGFPDRMSDKYPSNQFSELGACQLQESNKTDIHHCSEEISEQKLLSFAEQIATGMEYLAQRKFVHRDLAARNVLVCQDDVVKISDFGLTRDIYENSVYQKCTSGKLPIKWMSIEAIFDQVYTTQSDIWSFGVLLWEIVTLGGSPYPGISNQDIFPLLKDGYRMERPDNCSQQLYEMMLSCWHPVSSQRPDFTFLWKRLHDMLEQTLDTSDPCISFNLERNMDYYDYGSSCSSEDIGTKNENCEKHQNCEQHQMLAVGNNTEYLLLSSPQSFFTMEEPT